METSPCYIDPETGDTYPIDSPRWCAHNSQPLMLSELPGIKRSEIDSSERSIWRYAKSFPLRVDSPISMGEGCTPLVNSSFEGIDCSFKLEWFAPTGSFKDRGTSVMLSLLQQQGIQSVVEDSSGNGGASVAGYGARAGMKVKICVPASTQPAKIAQVRAYGAEVYLVPGPREATEAAAIEMAREVFYASHNWHPFFLQGTKTIGYEIWEDLGFRAPDNIVIPAGAGSNVLGCYLAFRELQNAGEIERLPRLFVSQPINCAPIHTAFQQGIEQLQSLDYAPTAAEGTAIKQPLRLTQLIEALESTNGGTAALTEEEIVKACLTLSGSGIYVEPSCAHAAAGFKQLVDHGEIGAEEKTVVLLTGTGLKATSFYSEQLAPADAPN
ncbi:MAG: threonine synthase [Pseudomonadota bacterium]